MIRSTEKENYQVRRSDTTPGLTFGKKFWLERGPLRSEKGKTHSEIYEEIMIQPIES